MKARFFAIAALVLGLASCQKDFAPEANLGAEVDYRLEVSATELGVTRAGDTAENPQEAKDSAFGAIDYFQGADWSKVDLRYTLEIYDANEDGSLKSTTPVKDRQAIVVDEYKAVTFETRLAPKRHYRFVVFADFVENGAATAWSEADKLTKDGLNHRIGTTLANIELINEDINDEASDAYFAFKEVIPGNNTHNTDAITLTRPYGKLRVVATDLHELNLNVKPGSVKVVYDAYNAKTFNAVEGTISGEYAEKEFDYDYVNEGIVYTAGKDALKGEKDRNTHMTIFTDYILATDNQHTIKFNMLVNDTDGVEIKATAFSTEIPVQRNHLTTIIGNVLTTATEVEVTINDNFANEAFVIDGEFTLTEDWNVSRSIIVEEGSKAVINLNGYSIINNSTSTELGIGDGIIVYGELEINGEGTIQGNTRAIWARGNTGAKVTINGGNIVGAVAGNCEVVYASGNGQIEINGGTFEAVMPDEVSFAAPQYAVLNLHGNGKTGCDIKVKGGSFKNFDPSNNISENPKYDFCAEGYGTIQDGEWYEVVSMAIVNNADEFTAAAANAEIKAISFANDIDFGTLSAAVRTDKVIYGNGYKLIAGGQSTKNYGLQILGAKVEINNIVMNGGGGIYVSGSDVTVNDVILKAQYVNNSGRHVFYVNNSVLTVNNGEFEVLRTKSRYIAAENNAKVYVKGGTWADMLSSYEPVYLNNAALEISGGKFQVNYSNYKFDPTEWLADGYKAERVGDYMEVSAE